MSDAKDNLDIAGRKIFFLYPSPSVINQVITELIQQEFEVYISKNHANLGRALKKYPDSIVYINIDDGMPIPEWGKWVESVLPSVPDLKFGVFSTNNDDEFREKVTKDLHITCGFIISKVDMSKTIDKIPDILNAMNVKGRRKYLRANTERETTATVNMPYRGGYINGVIKDISVVGISCSFEHDPELAKNSLFKGVQIRLQSMLLNVETIVFGSRMDDNQKIYVMLFSQMVDSEIRVKIRKYIQQNLQKKIDSEIN